jgi:hypothetical protein
LTLPSRTDGFSALRFCVDIFASSLREETSNYVSSFLLCGTESHFELLSGEFFSSFLRRNQVTKAWKGENVAGNLRELGNVLRGRKAFPKRDQKQRNPAFLAR